MRHWFAYEHSLTGNRTVQICMCVLSSDQIKFLHNFKARLFVPNNSIRLTATCSKGTKTMINHCSYEKHRNFIKVQEEFSM